MDHGQKALSYISHETVTATTRLYKRNNLVQYLIKTFGAELTKKLVCHYFIGTAKHWPGATVFWQIDTHDQVRTGKVMLYDATTGKRVKKPFSHITWAHSLLSSSCRGSSSRAVGENVALLSNSCNSQNDQKNTATATATATNIATPIKQCLFGEHLLKDYPGMPVAIVESEKTAIIAAGYNRSHIWLACGSISNLNIKMCRALKGRQVTLYPDLGAYDKWLAKARVLQRELKRTTIQVSNVLELNATDAQRKEGLDIGDVLGR